MLSLNTVRRILEVADNAKNHRDFATSNRAFVGLLSAFLEEDVEEGVSLLWQQGSHPFYDVLVIAVGDLRLRLPRPLLALEPYDRFYDLSEDDERPKSPAKRPDNPFKDCSSELEEFGLTIPEGWLLEAEAPSKKWMSPDEIKDYGRWHYGLKQGVFDSKEDEATE